MTLPTHTPASSRAGWAARPVTEADHDAVLALFDDGDFYFRTHVPDTLSQRDVLALLTEDTRLLTVDGAPVGLMAVEAMGPEHVCHHRLHLRLRGDVPRAWWREAYEEAVAALCRRTEVVTLTVAVGAFDPLGIAVLRDDLGFEDCGLLEGTVLHRGERSGHHYFSRPRTEAR